MKIITIFIMLLCLISVVQAAATSQSYAAGTTYSIDSYCALDNTPILTGATVTVYYPNRTSKLINSHAMTHMGGGLYTYDNISPSITGDYLAVIECGNLTGATNFKIYSASEEVERVAYLQLILLFAISIAFFVLAYNYNQPLFHVINTVWLLGFSVAISEQLFGGLFSIGMLFIVAISLYTTFEAYTGFIEKQNNAKNQKYS